ncbi:ATP-binding cassette domain-containing protein, partial [Paenibacillus sepulcri]|nr:ATP-binding cassette domain-containing protein [Paenibacillus sepulcri]
MPAMNSAKISVFPEKAPRETIIEVANIHKIFAVNGNKVTVFNDMSYSIDKGSFLSIVGPSGCGKSTLLKLISGLELPTKGKIVFRGREISGPPKGMIYVFQQYSKSILPWRTVIQNIEFGLKSHKKLNKKETLEKCMEYVRLVGLEGYEHYYPSQLSGGMQQRVVIARA